MEIKEFEFYKKNYKVEYVINNDNPKKVDIVLPIWNNSELAKHAIHSLYKNTKTNLFNLWVVDNGSTNSSLLEYKNKLISSPRGNSNILTNHIDFSDWRGSEAHALALNASIPFLTSEYMFIMHDDSVALQSHWLDFLLEKADEGNTAVGTYTNWSKNGVDFLHCSGLLVKTNFVRSNNINFSPSNPHYDTAGMLTLKLKETNSNFFVCKNSKNNLDLRKYHLYDHERGSESFDDNLVPIWAHQGRGSSQGDRGNFVRKI